MSLILAWILFPALLAALGAGWGVLVEKASGARLRGALLIPVGLAAVIVEASLFTSFSVTAKAAGWIAVAGAVVGLVWGRPVRIPRWAALGAVGALLAYGAPVIFSGQATFLGYIRLDDTATWLNIVDVVMHHGHSVAGLPPSTFELTYIGDVGTSYPLGSFMLLGVGHFITGIDAAWIFQPYEACCGAAVALCVFALLEPLVPSPRVRALTAFVGSQAALLYGYSLWGGIKELTAAFLLVLGLTLAGFAVQTRRAPPARRLVPLAVTAGALVCTLSLGAAAWVMPALVAILLLWLRRTEGKRDLRAAIRGLMWLVAVTAACAVPVWLSLSKFLSTTESSLISSGQDTHTLLGNLYGPLKATQLAGIWPNGNGDFRLSAPEPVTAILIGLVILGACYAVWRSAREQHFGLVIYATVAPLGCAIVYAIGSTPWVVAKTLAFSSPALLSAGLAGAAMLCARRRAGIILMALLTAGVLWSNFLQYHNVLLAPRPRLAELQRIDGLIAGHGPTFINEYDIYADRHFLRDGAPVEPAEYRSVNLPTTDGKLLVNEGWADLDAFPISTLAPYRSLVVRRSPTYSLPPSIFRLVWQGRYYQLWQQPAVPKERLLAHVALGDSAQYPYCGNVENGEPMPLCPLQPVSVPACRAVVALGREAAARRAELIAYQRPAPIVARADQSQWPATWREDPVGHTLTPSTPGTAVMHIAVATAEPYELWLGGDFARGFSVSVDGHALGAINDELGNLNSYVSVGRVSLAPGVHTFEFTYPNSDLTPGSADNAFTQLTAVALEPLGQSSALLRVPADQARTLCGRSLDWIDIAQPLGAQP